MKRATKVRIGQIFALVLVLVLMFGSNSYTKLPQIDMRAVVTMLGIDKTENGIRATAHILVPVSTDESASNQNIAEAEGKNLYEALNKFSISQGRRVEFSQCGMIVFGETISSSGILDEIEELFARGYVSAGVIMVNSEKMEAGEFLKLANKLGQETSSGISNFITYFQNSMALPSLSLMQFLSSSVSESKSSFMPCIALKDKSKSSSTQEGSEAEGGEGSEGGSESESESDYSQAEFKSISNIAIYKDGKKTAKLADGLAEGFIMTLPESKKGTYYIEEFSYKNKQYGAMYGDVSNKKVKTSVKFENSKPVVDIAIKMRITLSAKHEFLYELDNHQIDSKDFYAQMAEAFGNRIRTQVKQSFQESQKHDTDFFNFKYLFSRLCAKELKHYLAQENSNFLSDLTLNIITCIDVE